MYLLIGFRLRIAIGSRVVNGVQARDLLQHLWTGPISNAPVDIVQGSKSVEVRPVGISKVRSCPGVLTSRLHVFLHGFIRQNRRVSPYASSLPIMCVPIRGGGSCSVTSRICSVNSLASILRFGTQLMTSDRAGQPITPGQEYKPRVLGMIAPVLS